MCVTWKFSGCKQESELTFQNFSSLGRSLKHGAESKCENVTPLISAPKLTLT